MSLSAETPDWSREEKKFFSWHPSRSLLASIRAYQRNAKSRSPWRILARKWAAFRYLFWSAITSSDISLTCEIGGGLLLPHPNGVVIHMKTRIGPTCLIFQQVTIGSREGETDVPLIGGDVNIGAGAKIIGKVHVGNHARFGANAVVLKDVPAGKTAVGIPAVIVGG